MATATWARSEPYNDHGQAIDARSKDFSTFISTLSRKSKIAPSYVMDWRYVNLRAKEIFLSFVRLSYEENSLLFNEKETIEENVFIVSLTSLTIILQERFGMDGSNKSWRYVLEEVASYWRKSKNKLKKNTFKAGATVAQQVAVRPQYIP